jgi:hypothetical protein
MQKLLNIDQEVKQKQGIIFVASLRDLFKLFKKLVEK